MYQKVYFNTHIEREQMLHTTDEMKKLEQRLRKEQRRNRIIAKIIKSTYRSDFFEGKECEFDNPNSTFITLISFRYFNFSSISFNR